MKTIFLNNDINDNSFNEHTSTQECVLTIGNFDGFHLGHQAMINTALDIAKKDNLQTAVMVFEPMPKEFFSPDTAPARLMNINESKQVFSRYRYHNSQIDTLIVVNFNDEFRSLSAEEFISLITTKLKVSHLVIGDDFRFGHDRSGDYNTLQHGGFTVTMLNTVTHACKVDSARISSTLIRETLAHGDIDKATRLLGRDYYMIGSVLHGDKIGRTLDFPTANVALSRVKPALHGVFAVDVQVLDDEGHVIQDAWDDIAEDGNYGVSGLQEDSLFGAANVGTRPAVNGKEWRLEVHFPQFKGNLYDKNLKVRFLYYLHGERQYNGLTELKTGIKQDVVDLLAWRTNQLTK